MSVTTESGKSTDAPSSPLPLAKSQHRRCFACGAENPSGLQLRFTSVGSDEVECTFVAGSELQGYDGVLQGGIVATLLDSAMTNVLLQRRIEARTAEMEIRFRHPVPVAKGIIVRGRLEMSRGRLHVLSARILREERVLAEARAKFLETDTRAQQ